MTLRTEAVPHSATRRCQPGALSSGARRSARPHPPGLDDDETADQSHAEPAHSMRDGRKANQDHSRFTDRKAGDDRIVRTAHEGLQRSLRRVPPRAMRVRPRRRSSRPRGTARASPAAWTKLRRSAPLLRVRPYRRRSAWLPASRRASAGGTHRADPPPMCRTREAGTSAGIVAQLT